MADVVDRSGEVSTELPSIVIVLYSWMLIVPNARGLPAPIKLKRAASDYVCHRRVLLVLLGPAALRCDPDQPLRWLERARSGAQTALAADPGGPDGLRRAYNDRLLSRAARLGRPGASGTPIAFDPDPGR